MKICYISPKKNKKQKNIRVYDLAIVSLFKSIASIPNREVQILFIVCLVLALVAAIQNVVMENNKSNKWDKALEKHEKKKKIKKMLEEQEAEKKGSRCTNVDTKNLI